MGNKNKNSFLKGAFILGVAGIIVKIIGAFFRIPLGNMIGDTGIANYQAAYPVYTLFFTLATAGFPTAVAKLVSEKNAIGDYKGAHKIFRVSSTVLFITGIVSFTIFFLGARYIVEKIIKIPEAYYSMLAISPALLFVPVMSSFRGYFQGRQEMGKIAVSQISEQFFRVIVGLGLAYVFMQRSGPSLGAAGAMAGAAIGSVASILYLVFAYLKDGKSRKIELKSSRTFKRERISHVLKRILAVAIPITIGASVMPLVNMVDTVIVTDRLINGAMIPYDEAKSLFGQLTGMAMSIINMPSVITIALSTSLVPSISESYALGNKGKARKDTQSAIKVTLLLVLPCAFGLASLANPIMDLLYPNIEGQLGTILLFLTPCVVLLGLIQTMNGILQGMGKPIVPVIALMCGMVCKIILSYTLTGIPEINIYGSVIGTISAYLIAVIIEIIYVRRKMGVKFPVTEFIIKPLITVVAMFAVVRFGYSTLETLIAPKLATVVSIGLGGIVYVLVLLGIGAMSKEEILSMPKGEKIYKLLKKIRLAR